jgi:nicotinate-nucleotide adenylyltransferase
MPHTLLYGGTFDPIHHGHLITAQRARELLQADRVLFIPAHLSPHKLERESAAADHRLAMLHMAIADNPFFQTDARELQREGPSYTITTIESLQADNPNDQFTLLIGADQLPKFHTWHRVSELIRLVKIAILRRPLGGTTEDNAEQHQALAKMSQELAGRATILDTPLIEISATSIRQRANAGLPIDYLVPQPVADYIRDHGLYRTH